MRLKSSERFVLPKSWNAPSDFALAAASEKLPNWICPFWSAVWRMKRGGAANQ